MSTTTSFDGCSLGALVPSCGPGDSPSGKLLPNVARPVNVWGHAKKNCRMNWQVSYKGVLVSLSSIHRSSWDGVWMLLSMASVFFRTGRNAAWVGGVDFVTHQALATHHLSLAAWPLPLQARVVQRESYQNTEFCMGKPNGSIFGISMVQSIDIEINPFEIG